MLVAEHLLNRDRTLYEGFDDVGCNCWVFDRKRLRPGGKQPVAVGSLACLRRRVSRRDACPLVEQHLDEGFA